MFCVLLILPKSGSRGRYTNNNNKSLRTIIFLLSTSFAILPPEPRPTVRRTCTSRQDGSQILFPKAFHMYYYYFLGMLKQWIQPCFMRFLDLFVKHRKYVTFKPIRKMLVQYLKQNVHFPTSNGFVRRSEQRTFYFTHEAQDFQIVL